jgi:hypothetical protein
MKIVNFLIIASAVTADNLFANNELSIEEAAKKGLVKLIIKGKGGFTGDVIEMKITNNTTVPLHLNVNPGLRLDSKDETQQDILVTKEQEIYLAAKQQRSFNIFGMCCQAHNSAPVKNSVYMIGRSADSNLVKLASFIDKNNYSSSHTAQQAVWVVSDNNSIASIVDGTNEEINKLRKYVSDITGRPIPKYNVYYKQQDNSDIGGTVNKVEGVLDYSLNINNYVTIGIYDSSGKLIQLLFQQRPHESGDYKLYYTFKTHNLPGGTYYARMSMDGAIMKEEKIEF